MSELRREINRMPQNASQRVIKFRAWSPGRIPSEDGYMHYDVGVKNSNVIIRVSDGALNSFWEHDTVTWKILHHAIPMQFAGLKDTATGSKNGKDIYEGDIVKFKAMILGKREDAVGYVHFNTPSFEICLIKPEEYAGKSRPMINWIQKEMEVIGNIYENPELLGSPTESAGQ